MADARKAGHPIQVAHVGKMTVQRSVEVSGTLVSPDAATLSSEASGVVRSVLVELGQHVSVGQELVRLDSRELIFARERAESALRQVEAELGMVPDQVNPPADEELSSVRVARANRDDARAVVERATRLAGRGLLANVELESGQTRASVADAAYQSAIEEARSLKASLQDRRASLRLAEKRLSDAIIRAPVAGSIAARLVQPGAFVAENTPVVTVVQMHPLKLRVSVQERYVAALRPGLQVSFTVAAFPKQLFSGRVEHISPVVDRDARSLLVEAVVDNRDGRLKPGFFAVGAVVTGSEEVIAVPEAAVLTLTGMSTVFVVEDGTVRQQVVALGALVGSRYEIREGLKGGEIVATTSLTQLGTGVPVAVTTATTGGSPP